MYMRSVVVKNVCLPPAYIQKIQIIKQELGVSSDSEVIRRAIDVYMNEIGLNQERWGNGRD